MGAALRLKGEPEKRAGNAGRHERFIRSHPLRRLSTARVVHNRAAEVLGAALTARLGEAASFSLDGNVIESGHKAADLLDLVESGELSMCYFATSYLAERVPEFALFDLPFTTRSREQAYAALDGPLGALLSRRLEASSGYRLLGFWDNGLRHLSNSLRPIRSPEDCKGLRIRTLFSELHTKTFRLLGFEPVALDVKDLLAGVKSGEITAQESPLTNTYNFGIHEFHRHITLTGHFFGVAALLCHGASYDSWPPSVQEAVVASAAEATAAQRLFAAAEDDTILRKLEEAGNEVTRLSQAEGEQFAASVVPLVEAERQRFGPNLFRHLEAG